MTRGDVLSYKMDQSEVVRALLSQAIVYWYSPRTDESRRLDLQVPGEFIFNPQDIHVWTIPLDQPIETLSFLGSLLSQDETTRAAKLRIQQPRDRFISGRGWLRLILSTYIGCAPGELIFRYGGKGKPHLSPIPGKEECYFLPSFNLTHSNGTALLAVTPAAQIGVDIELIHPITEINSIAQQYFSQGESMDILSQPEKDKISVFYQIWTRKEAYIKARGDGFSLPLDSFSVRSAGSNNQIFLESDENDPDRKTIPDPNWQLIPIKSPEGFSAALVLENQKNLIE